MNATKSAERVKTSFKKARTRWQTVSHVTRFSVQWRELVRGKLVTQIDVDQARLNFVNAPSKEDRPAFRRAGLEFSKT